MRGIAVATMVWSSAPRNSATRTPARVNPRSRFVTVYMIEITYWCPHSPVKTPLLPARRGSGVPCPGDARLFNPAETQAEIHRLRDHLPRSLLAGGNLSDDGGR